MKNKILLFFAVFVCSFCIGLGCTDAYTISSDGKYSLILRASEGEIEGLSTKVIKFDLDENETIKLSDLTKGIVPFNGKTNFSHWGKNIFDNTKAKEELTASDFNWESLVEGVNYSNSLVLWAQFSEEALKGTGTYYITINPFAGKVDGKDIIKLTSRESEFKTIDLSKYKAERNGYTFIGWGYDGRFISSIDRSYFENADVIEVTAVYKKNTFEEDDSYILVLDANGGKIDGMDVNKYNYVGGETSATEMSIFQYVPVREGYKFNGWKAKKDGSGETYNYIYWGAWRNQEDSVFEKDTLNEEYDIYKNLTLYASWTKDVNVKKEFDSSSSIKGTINFENGINENYKLDIKNVELKKELEDKNVKFVVDINMLDGNNIVKIDNTKMKIKILLPDNLKGFNEYKVVYILNDEIKETIKAKVEDGYIVFETNHLSQYGIIATSENNPKTFDSTSIYITTGILSLITLIGVTFKLKQNEV